jgi:hypothetical protein
MANTKSVDLAIISMLADLFNYILGVGYSAISEEVEAPWERWICLLGEDVYNRI